MMHSSIRQAGKQHTRHDLSKYQLITQRFISRGESTLYTLFTASVLENKCIRFNNVYFKTLLYDFIYLFICLFGIFIYLPSYNLMSLGMIHLILSSPQFDHMIFYRD